MKIKFILLILASSTAEKRSLTPENYVCVSTIHFEKVLPNHVVYLFNYNNYTAGNRPLGYKLMHIIDSLIIFKDSGFLRLQHTINRNDIVVFIERKKKIPRKLLDNLFFIRFVFFIKNDVCEIYYCVYENSQQTCTLKNPKPDSKKPDKKPQKRLSKYVREETVGYIKMPPHAYLKNGKLVGIEVNILEIFSKMFNFTYKLIDFDDFKQVDHIGQMLQNVKTGNISWAIGAIMLTTDRQSSFEKLKYIFVDGYFAIFNKNFERITIKKFILRNIQYHSLCFLSGSCVCAIGYIYCKLFKKEHIKTYIMLAFLPLYEQTYPFKIIKSSSMRILFVSWWVMCFILIISYKTYLIEFRIKDPKIEYSLEDLVDEGFRFEAYIDDYFYIKEECTRMSSTFCKKLLPKCSYFIDTCKAGERMFSNKIALIGEMHTIKYMVHLCTSARLRQSEIKFSTNRIFGLQIHFWPLLKSSFLVEKFSEKVDLIEQAGLYVHWIGMEIHVKTLGKTEKHPKEYTLELKDVVVPFCILSAGYVLSIVLFLGELFKNKKIALKK